MKEKQEEMLKEMEMHSKEMIEFAKKRIKSLTKEDLEHPDYCGFDYLHDAVHTLRGRLPHGGAELKAMRDLWKNK